MFNFEVQKLDSEVEKLINNMTKQEESILLEQLSELISRGLIVIYKEEPVLTHEEKDGTHTVKISSAVRLVLKDHEYIQRIEKENAELKARIQENERSLTLRY